MALADEIQDKVAAGQFEFSRHAVDQTLKRHISVQEIRDAIAASQVLEEYPDDKYGPSCLLLGFTQAQRPLHLQCSYPARPLIKIITVYEPDPRHWTDYQIRRQNHDNT